MSLINQMLKDLEQRRTQDAEATGEPSLQGVDPAVGAAGPRRGGRPLVLALTLVLLFVGSFGLLWWQDAEIAPELPAPPQKQTAAAIESKPVRAEEIAPPIAPVALSTPAEEPQVAVAEPTFSESPNRAAPSPKAEVVVPKPQQPGQLSNVEPKPQPAVVAARPAVLQTLRLNEQRSYLRLVFYFDRIPPHRLSRGAGEHRLVLDLAQTRLVGSLPSPPKSSLLEGIEVSRESGGLTLTLKLKSGFRYLEAVENAERDFGKRLVVDLYPKSQPMAAQAPVAAVARNKTLTASVVARPETPPLVQGQVAKVQLGDSLDSEVERAYQGASAALGRDDWSDAERLLRQVLRLDSRHLGAREVLVGRFLQVGRLSEAFVLLAEGVRLKPEHLGFRKPYARLLVDQGAFQEALQVLLRGGLPEVLADPEAHALLAAIYQQLGEYSLAARSYRQLVGVRPEAGLWWMGLGIAQEGEGQGAEALQAYRRALATGSLRADLMAYVHQRYRELDARVQQ